MTEAVHPAPASDAGVPSRSPATHRVLFVASEAAPFAKTGGLADVLGSLPRALARRGHQCAVLMPLYNSARKGPGPIEPTPHRFHVPVGGVMMPGRLWRGRLPQSDVTVYFLESPDYFARDDASRGAGIYQYSTPQGQRDYDDNCARFVFLSRATLAALPFLDWTPDVIHANDWQTGLVPVYLRDVYRGQPDYDHIRTVYTIHNLAYQGAFWKFDMEVTGLDWRLFNYHHLEAYDGLNLMKGGIVFSDAVTTVSPRYAEEIQTAEYGCGLESVLRAHRHKLVGIVNGVDYDHWDPATDPHLPTCYGVDTVAAGKARCKAALQERVRLPARPHVPLLGMVSRLVDQKGVDLLLAAAPELLRHDVQLVVLGTGDPGYQEALRRLAEAVPSKVSVYLGFSEEFAHLIEAGSDAFLMPSRYEPSGLNQLYSLKYGTVPIVRDVGGLSNTVVDANPATLANGWATGFVFRGYSAGAFLATIHRALLTYHAQPEDWRRMQRTGMLQDWSWDQRAPEYERVYDRVLHA